MPKVRLNDIVVKNLPVPAKDREMYWDESLAGFGVRVSQGGSKTFIVMHGRSRKRTTIGRYPIMSLADARQRARAIMLDLHVNPDQGPRIDYPEAVRRFLSVKETEIRQSTWKEYERLLRGKFGTSAGVLDDIETEDVLVVLDGIEKVGERAHVYTALKVFFNWCVDRRYCRDNPLRGIKKPRVALPRERVLSDDELVKVWNGCEGLGRFGAIVRLLAVTGQRRNQISRLQEGWVDRARKELHFPAEVMKNGKPHTVPLCSLGEHVILGQMPNKGFYFSPEGLAGHPFTAWSKNKRLLDRLVDIDPWTLHDLRRTWSTNAARLGIPQHITDRILSHSTGDQSPVSRIYNRYRYSDEVRDAMQRMNSHLLELLREGS